MACLLRPPDRGRSRVVSFPVLNFSIIVRSSTRIQCHPLRCGAISPREHGRSQHYAPCALPRARLHLSACEASGRSLSTTAARALRRKHPRRPAPVFDPFGSSSSRSQPTGSPKRTPVPAMLAAQNWSSRRSATPHRQLHALGPANIGSKSNIRLSNTTACSVSLAWKRPCVLECTSRAQFWTRVS